MSWLKLTSKTLYLVKGGTNKYLEKVDLAPHGNTGNEFKIAIPSDWLTGSDAPNVVVVDVGSTEELEKAVSDRTSDDTFSRVVKRSEWNAKPPTSRFEIIDLPRSIVIHHTDTKPSTGGGTQAAKTMAANVQSSHMKGNGWSDIGYNFLNSVEGVLLEGRFDSLAQAIKSNTVRGAHAGTNEGNSSPGIANEGNFMTKAMNTRQWQSLVDMCAALCESCDINPINIKGHRDFVATDCPGDWLYSQLPKLRKDVAAHLAR
jgi:hypothetical protein